MALNLFSRLMPPEKSFTSQFCAQATCIVEAAQELRDMVGRQDVAIDKHVASIRVIEKNSGRFEDERTDPETGQAYRRYWL